MFCEGYHYTCLVCVGWSGVSLRGAITCLLFVLTADRGFQRILLELLNQMDGFDQTVNV